MNRSGSPRCSDTLSLTLLAATFAWLLGGTAFASPPTDVVLTPPYYGSNDFTPVWMDADDEALQAFHRIAAFSVTDQTGAELTAADLAGHVYVVNFFFTTCPGICPRMQSRTARVQEAFADDDRVRLVSFSITPSVDTVPVLSAWGAEAGAIPGKWHLVTGDREHIYEVARGSFFAEENLGQPQGNGDFLHSGNLLLVDERGFIRGVYNGLNDQAVEDLIGDLKVLLRGIAGA